MILIALPTLATLVQDVYISCTPIMLHCTHAKMNNLINVVNNLLQCCAAHCQTMLCRTLSTTVVNNHCSQLFMFNNHCSIIVENDQQVFSSTIFGSCSNNIVTTIVLCQHRTTIDQTILINIVNSTSVVEP